MHELWKRRAVGMEPAFPYNTIAPHFFCTVYLSSIDGARVGISAIVPLRPDRELNMLLYILQLCQDVLQCHFVLLCLLYK
jgi:hypothetical protein